MSTKRIIACSVCKRRKGKCVGGIPCNWCVSHKVECIKDAPTSSHPQRVQLEDSHVNPQELELITDSELSQYLTLGFKHYPFTTLLGGYELESLQHATTQSKIFLKYIMCALTTRALGNKGHSAKLISDAQKLSTELVEDKSVESLAAFALLTLYSLGSDVITAKHYGNIMLSLYSSMSHQVTVPDPLACCIMAFKVYVASSLSPRERLSKFLEETQEMLIRDCENGFMVAEIRLVAKIFGHTKSLSVTYFRSDILAVIFSHVLFTQEQKRDILSEIDVFRKLFCAISPGNRIHAVTCDILEIIVNWRSGNGKAVLPLAIELADKISVDKFVFGTRIELEYLLSIIIFLYEHQQLAACSKLHVVATALHDIVRTPVTLPECTSTFISLIQDNLAQQQPQVPSTPPDNVLGDPETVVSVVERTFSLMAIFLPPGDPRGLLSPQGLHVLFKTISTLCPPTPSTYDFDPRRDHPSGFGSVTDLRLPFLAPNPPSSPHRRASSQSTQALPSLQTLIPDPSASSNRPRSPFQNLQSPPQNPSPSHDPQSPPQSSKRPRSPSQNSFSSSQYSKSPRPLLQNPQQPSYTPQAPQQEILVVPPDNAEAPTVTYLSIHSASFPPESNEFEEAPPNPHPLQNQATEPGLLKFLGGNDTESGGQFPRILHGTFFSGQPVTTVPVIQTLLEDYSNDQYGISKWLKK